MIEIKITLEHTPENLELLLAAAKAAQPAKEETKKEEEPKTKKPAKKEEEPKTKTAAKKEEEPKTKAPAKKETKTKNDIRYLALALTKDGKEDKIAEVFAEFGASRLSEIKEEDFPAVYEKLVVFDE